METLAEIERQIAEHRNAIGELSCQAGNAIAASKGVVVGTRVRWKHGDGFVEGFVQSWSWAGGKNINIVVKRVLKDGSISPKTTALHWYHDPQVVHTTPHHR